MKLDIFHEDFTVFEKCEVDDLLDEAVIDLLFLGDGDHWYALWARLGMRTVYSEVINAINPTDRHV